MPRKKIKLSPQEKVKIYPNRKPHKARGSHRLKAPTVNARATRADIVQMRIEGKRVDQIAELTGYTVDHVRREVRRGFASIEEHTFSLVLTLKQQHQTRLEELLETLYKRAVIGGDLTAVDRYLKVLQEVSKLNGFDRIENPQGSEDNPIHYRLVEVEKDTEHANEVNTVGGENNADE